MASFSPYFAVSDFCNRMVLRVLVILHMINKMLICEKVTVYIIYFFLQKITKQMNKQTDTNVHAPKL